MAVVETNGLDEIIENLDCMAYIPEGKLRQMLYAGADVLVQAQKDEIAKQGLVDTERLKDSIARTDMKVSRSGARVVYIYPQGSRPNGKKSNRNADVGFIQEYGSPHRKIRAHGWMSKANERAGEKAVYTAVEIFEDFIDQYG